MSHLFQLGETCVSPFSIPGSNTEHGYLLVEMTCVQRILLGAICGSARSMDRAAQSIDLYFVQESMDHAGICGSSCANLRSLNFAY